MLLSLSSLSNIAVNNMARQIRKKSGTGIYHVMLRGINRQDIFEDNEDYLQMTSILRAQSERTEWSIKICSLLWGWSPTTVKTNWRFIWSNSEVLEPHSMVNSKHIMRFNYIFNIWVSMQLIYLSDRHNQGCILFCL